MKRINSELKEAKTIAIGGHVRPDGDCVCSVMALYHYLKKELPEAEVDVYLEEPPAQFHILEGIEDIKSEFNNDKVYDVFIALDCNDERLGDALPIFRRAKRRINIDHHISNTGCGDVNIVEPERSSTSELLYDLMEKEYVDERIAKAVYIGIAHDTGVFRYSNTSAHTFQIAAELLKFGFDFSALIEETFYEKTYFQTQIMEFYCVGPKDLDGIVNQLQGVKGVDCAIFMYETGTLEYKVSMRSNGLVDVSQVAVKFGGGGHVRAAGCTMNGTYHDNINNLSVEIAAQIKERDESDHV